MFELSDITVKHQHQCLLNSISLTIPSGQIMGIVGPNGAGKSTLLKVMAGLIKPKPGEVVFNQKRLSEWPIQSLAQHIGYFSQAPRVHAEFTVQEVAELGRYPYRHLARSVNQEVVLGYLEKLGLIGWQNRPFNQLSGGEQQRVHLARLLIQLENSISPKQKFLLLDEHMAHLDWVCQLKTFEYLQKIAESGVGVVIISHDIAKLRDYAHDVVLMNKASVFSQGQASEILNPAVLNQIFELKSFEFAN